VGGYEDALGVKFDYRLLYQNVTSLSMWNIDRFLDAGYNVTVDIEFTVGSPNLIQIRDGAYDAELTAFANDLATDGRLVWLRPMHEFNGDWYDWAVFSSDQHTPEIFQQAWIHLVEIFRTAGANVKFQLSYNRWGSDNNQTPFSDFYPGDDYVDMVTVSCYNRSGTDAWHNSWVSFHDLFQDPYDAIVAMTDKPVGVAETSTTSWSGAGDKPQWIIDAFSSVAYDFPQVTYLNWFFYNKQVAGEGPRDWDLNTAADEAAFVEGYQLLKNARP
jgi:hypothetical protein